MTYQIDTSLPGLTFTPQASTALTAWKAPGEIGAPAGFTDTIISTANGIQTHEAKIPLTSGNRVFMRMRVAMP